MNLYSIKKYSTKPIKLVFKKNRFSVENTCKKNDNPTSKQPKHVPTAETCEYSGIQNYFYSTPLHSRDFLTFLPIEVAAFQIYPSKLPLMLSLESVQNHVNHLKSIK